MISLEGRTSISIAHRLSTVANLDRTVILEDGRMVQDGIHDELVIQDGVYSQLWNYQIGLMRG